MRYINLTFLFWDNRDWTYGNIIMVTLILRAIVAFLCEYVALGFTLNGVHQQKRYIMEIRYLDICVMIQGSQGIQKQKRINRNVKLIKLHLIPLQLVIILFLTN